jgi:hypothetical protein
VSGKANVVPVTADCPEPDVMAMVAVDGTFPTSLNVARSDVPTTVAFATRLPMAMGVAVTAAAPEEGVMTVALENVIPGELKAMGAPERASPAVPTIWTLSGVVKGVPRGEVCERPDVIVMEAGVSMMSLPALKTTL